MENKNKQKAEKTFLTVFIVVMCFIILGFVVNGITPVKKYSENENRSLAERPELSFESVLSGDYFKNYDKFYSDQFTGRNFFMKTGSAFDTLSGRPESGGVYKGKDGYLFGKGEVPDKKAEKKTAEAVSGFAKKHGNINTYMLLIPSSGNILENKLPFFAPVEDQIKEIKDFQSEISNVDFLDGVSPLKDASDKYIYYRTDHHWTSEGALKVFKKTAKDMGIYNPVKKYKKYTVTDSFYGTLASKSGKMKNPDEISVYSPENNEVQYVVSYPDTNEKSASMFVSGNLDKKDKYLVFFGGNHALVDIKTTAPSDKTLLVMKDSYANSYMQFLYPYYKRIIMIDPRYYYDNINTVISSYGVTDMLYLYSCDTIVKDTNLADTLNAGMDR